MPWCVSCGTLVDDGMVLCSQCVPKGDLAQSVTIEMISAPNVVLDSDGNVVENIPGYGKATTKAFDMSEGSKKRSPLRAVQKIQWNHDRKRNERAVWLYDRKNNVYCETWFDLDTGQITWGPKRGLLSDQSIHGRNA
jgi:hypothetical protein